MVGRGMSPVLASLLLVVIAVAAALVTYVWVSSYLRSAERGVETPQFRELLKVEGVRAGDGGVIVTVRNIGSAKLVLKAVYVLKGDVTVAAEKLDLELEPGQAADVRVSAEVQPGDYTVNVVTATGVEAYARLPLSGTSQLAVTAQHEVELVRNGDFSEGSAYWTLEEPWVVDPQQYARVSVSTNKDFAASISQDLGIPLGTVNLTLSFRYYLAAHPPGQVNRLELKAYLLSGSNVVWESAPIAWDGSRVPVWRQFAQIFPFNLAGPATLKITLFADVKEVGIASSIDAGIDDVSLAANAPP